MVLFLQDLDYGKLAKGFGLLKLPVMPELKDKTVDFEPVDVNVDKIYYRDKARERQRKRKLQEQQKESSDTAPWKKWKPSKGSIPWSKTKERKAKREKRRARREFLKKERQKQSFDEEELKDLAHDVRLIKKLKSGKITEAEFNSQLGSEEEV